MSLDGLRDVYIREKKNEIANCERSRKRKLRELYHYSALLEAGHQLHDWPSISDEPSENERLFLDANDISKGLCFNDSTLPYPVQHAPLPSTLPSQIPTKPEVDAFLKPPSSPVVSVPVGLEAQLRVASVSPSVASQTLSSNETPAQQDDSQIAKLPLHSPRVDSTVQTEPDVVAPVVEEEVAKEDSVEEAQESIDAQSTEVSEPVPAVQEKEVPSEAPLDGPTVDPKKAIPPAPEDVAELPDAEFPATPDHATPKAPQVVHLPPQEVQEARLKETERKLEKAREKEQKEDERLAIPNANPQPDFISSPSSTVGPYSQATPHAPHHSPDTSPDTETFDDRVPSSVENDLEPDPAAQQAKEEHERALQRQMQEAREHARGDDEESSTPEVERQLEDEQAIRLARDGKSHLSESESTAVSHSLTEHAEEVTEEVIEEAEIETENAVEVKTLQEPAAESLPTPTTTVPELSSLDLEGAEGVSKKPQESTPVVADHPTPPADVDVEMDDAPLPINEQEKAAPQPRSTPPGPDRMTTKVSSGAIRQKSVSDIIAEKATPVLTPRSSDLSAASESPARLRSSRDEKEARVSTVIFAKQHASQSTKFLQLYNEDYASLQGVSQDSSRDYLEGLFKYQAHHPPRSLPLQDLVGSARKTVSTAGMLAMQRESQDYKILKRVYQLQNANRWSLRQLQKSTEPPRPSSHLDHLLKEMKWMQTDFREERKWKKALAATFAEWCAEYVNNGLEERASLRIRARIPKHARQQSTTDEDMNDAPTPDLVHSGANETESESFADDEELASPFGTHPPAGLFSLDFNDVVMKIDRTPVSESMLQELPVYEPVVEGASDITPVSFCDPPILPVSKFVTGKLVSKVRGPSRKRSRYEYESEDEPSSPPSRSGTSAEHSMPSTPGRRLFHRNDLPPEMTDVALFNPENKHVRDRLQVSHQFRPPSEFLMPPVSFFENRSSSQWLWEEDQKLRGLVKEYTFNWSLVAQELALPSKFVSGTGRRTPWECFERWVQLEGLPAEMSKTQYFKTYQTRLEQAQRTIAAQHQAQQQLLQQQAQQGQNVSNQPRRRTTQPIRVERRRDNRHLAVIDAMRKLARKRESHAHKQAENAKAAALRKAHEPAAPKGASHTPQELSRIKWKREEDMKQKMQRQQEMNMRQAMAVAAQRQQAGIQGQSGMPNGLAQQQRNGTPGTNATASTPMANSTSQPGHPASNPNMGARQHPGQQALQANFPNGNMSGGMSMNNSGVPQAQMQATMQNPQRMPPPDQVRMAMQRGQYPNANQQQYQLQQQQINMASNLTANLNMGNGMPNANMMASMAGQNMNGNISAMNGMSNNTMSSNGMSNNTMSNGTMANNAGSPRMNQVNPQMQSPARPLSSGHMPQLLQIQNSLKAQYPDWPQEQVQKVASEQLTRFLTKQRQQAMSAASGINSGMNSSSQLGNNVYLQNNGMQNSPTPNAVQNYQNQLLQQQMRMSQQQRQQAGSPGLNAARPVSRSATPQNPQMGIQSPGSQHMRT